MRIALNILLITFFFCNNNSNAQLVSPNFFDFSLVIKFDQQALVDSTQILTKVNKLIAQSDSFCALATHEMIERQKQPTVYSLEIFHKNKLGIAIYIFMDPEERLFFRELMEPYEITSALRLRQIIFQLTSFSQGTYYLNLYDKKNKTQKKMFTELEAKRTDSTLIPQQIVFDAIKEYYLFSTNSGDPYAGGTVVNVSQKGLSVNKVSNEPISTEKIEEYLQNQKLKRPKLLMEIIEDLNDSE